MKSIKFIVENLNKHKRSLMKVILPPRDSDYEITTGMLHSVRNIRITSYFFCFDPAFNALTLPA